MKAVLIVKNCTREGPGLIEDLLKQRSVPFKIVDLDQEEYFPTLKDYSVLIVLGGPDSANDDHPKIKTAVNRIQEALSLKVPYLGICLGMQMLVKAGGGEVLKNPIREIGFRDSAKRFFEVNLTPQGEKDPLCKGIDPSFKIFHLHGETVQLTGQMTLLGTGKHCRHQIVKVGPVAYGFQGHLELTEKLFRLWIQEDPDLIAISRSDLEKDFATVQDEISKTGTKLFENFLTISGLEKSDDRNPKTRL